MTKEQALDNEAIYVVCYAARPKLYRLSVLSEKEYDPLRFHVLADADDEHEAAQYYSTSAHISYAVDCCSAHAVIDPQASRRDSCSEESPSSVTD